MNIISAKNISKIYPHPQGNIPVLKNISLEIPHGSSMSIVGESGRGKTTLLYLLSGLDRVNSGEIYVQDKRIDNLSEQELSFFRANKFGFIFQHHFLLSDLNALENTLMPLRITRTLSKESIERTKLLFESLDMSHRLYHEPDELSGGERQRIAIIRALVHNPLIIFADEPTGSLDKDNACKLEELLFNLTETHGVTLIVSTHNPRLAERCQIKTSIDKLEQG